MIRSALAVTAGLLAWTICAVLLDYLLRFTLSGYTAAEPQLQFTLGMMLARLALPGGIPSIAAGFVGAWISRGNKLVTWALIIILLAVFLPTHYGLWTKFPIWYHLTFLGSLPVLTCVGAVLRSRLVQSS